jgi:hypothetical protein
MKTSSRSGWFGALVLVAASCVASAGCGNPVVDVQVDALGGEVDGVDESEYHRPGQPCLLCHSAYGGASPEMAIAGTIFGQPTQNDALGIPVGGATINLVDSFGSTNPKPVVTNCMGNFWIPKDEWDPGFPLAVEVVCPAPGSKRVMNSRIGRDGSCARCHAGSPNQGSPGWVVCGSSYPAPTHATCPGGVP